MYKRSSSPPRDFQAADTMSFLSGCCFCTMRIICGVGVAPIASRYRIAYSRRSVAYSSFLNLTGWSVSLSYAANQIGREQQNRERHIRERDQRARSESESARARERAAQICQQVYQQTFTERRDIYRVFEDKDIPSKNRKGAGVMRAAQERARE